MFLKYRVYAFLSVSLLCISIVFSMVFVDLYVVPYYKTRLFKLSNSCKVSKFVLRTTEGISASFAVPVVSFNDTRHVVKQILQEDTKSLQSQEKSSRKNETGRYCIDVYVITSMDSHPRQLLPDPSTFVEVMANRYSQNVSKLIWRVLSLFFNLKLNLCHF